MSRRNLENTSAYEHLYGLICQVNPAISKKQRIPDTKYNSETFARLHSYQEVFWGRIAEIDFLIEIFNKIDYGHFRDQFPKSDQYMPKFHALKSLLQESSTQLIRLNEFTALSIRKGLLNAYGPIELGYNLQEGVVERNEEREHYAILTPSNPKLTPMDRAVGTTIHIIERILFEKLTKMGIVPENGWQKDDIIHALKEVQLFINARSNNQALPNVIQTMFRLGWLDHKTLDSFSKQIDRDSRS